MFIRLVYPVAWEHPLCLSLLADKVSARFPSPANDHLQNAQNLDEALIPHPAGTFMMTGCGIFSVDLLILDRSLNPVEGLW